ncbi:MAG TPA: hypothetical protein VNZ53_10915 [Steroidobacteraceae bacterium]|jgi:hypothetical protein|nr:hypothetical protein [Steroidobacteraceae bacterium]
MTSQNPGPSEKERLEQFDNAERQQGRCHGDLRGKTRGLLAFFGDVVAAGDGADDLFGPAFDVLDDRPGRRPRKYLALWPA